VSIPAASPLAPLLREPAMVERVRLLSQINNVRAAVAILRQWLVIAAVVAVAIYCNHWLIYGLAIIVIASRQHTLVVLMHDATHYRLFSNRTANDLLSDLFCAFPLGITTLGYRLEHLPHHGHVNTMDDPYYAMFQKDSVWHWPKTRWGALRIFLADVFFWNLPRNMTMGSHWMALSVWRRNRKNPQIARRAAWDLARTLTFIAVVCGIVTLIGEWPRFLLLWTLPSLTFFMLFVRYVPMISMTEIRELLPKKSGGRDGHASAEGPP
jgi:fatty acid desaturase